MKVKISNRFFSYLIDMILIFILMIGVNKLFSNQKIVILQNQMNEVHEKMLHHTVTFSEYIQQSASINQQLDRENIFSNLFNLIFIFIFFILIPFFNNGATIGQKIVKLKNQSIEGNLSLEKLVLRSVILNGIIYVAVTIVLVFLLPAQPYFLLVSILGIIQILLVITSGFMVLYRKDQIGLHEFISNTKVVSDNER